MKAIITTDLRTPTNISFIFDMTEVATKWNANILQAHDYDMKKVISAFQNSHVGYGSKFCAPSLLKPLLHNGPFWVESRRVYLW